MLCTLIGAAHQLHLLKRLGKQRRSWIDGKLVEHPLCGADRLGTFAGDLAGNLKSRGQRIFADARGELPVGQAEPVPLAVRLLLFRRQRDGRDWPEPASLLFDELREPSRLEVVRRVGEVGQVALTPIRHLHERDRQARVGRARGRDRDRAHRRDRQEGESPRASHDDLRLSAFLRRARGGRT